MPEENVPEKLVRVPVPALDAILGDKFAVLDKGFIRVIDYMGGDAAIVQSARVSYGKGTKRLSEDEGLIRYLLRHSHCYDDQTEVLTANGFKSWPTVKESDELGVWDPKKQSLCYEQPAYLTVDQYDGNLYTVEHGGVSLAVTPGHSMYVNLKEYTEDKQMLWSSDGFKLVKTDELGDRSMVRYIKTAPLRAAPDWSSESIFPPCEDPRELLRLIGFFIGDGTVSHTSANTISFRLRKQRKKDYLRGVICGVGWDLRVGIDGEAFSIHAPGISQIFRDNFYTASGDKKVPTFLRRMNTYDSNALLDGLRNSDGSQKRGTWVYSSSIADVAQAVQLICLHAGEAAHVGQNCEGMWNVMVLSRMREPVINQGKKNTGSMPYSGKVYCAKTRTGILVVRRNGKIVLSGNTTPFEMCEIKFHVRVPMDCWRQWIRHRMSSTNEYSTRYSEAIDDKQCTPPDAWRLQSGTNKQGSGGNLFAWPDQDPPGVRSSLEKGKTPGEYLSIREKNFHADAASLYQERLDFGVAKEVARKDLPLSTYTEAYWKIDLHNLMHFLSLRMDKHAQLEIRSYANAMGDIVAKWCPLAWAAFNDYNFRRDALLLSSRDKRMIACINDTSKGHSSAAEKYFDLAHEFGWLERDGNGKIKTNRERVEFEAKLEALGMTVPNWA